MKNACTNLGAKKSKYASLEAHTSAHMSLEAQTSAHVSAYISAYASLGAHMSTHTSLEALVCVLFCHGLIPVKNPLNGKLEFDTKGNIPIIKE